jgi:hypothetical protein
VVFLPEIDIGQWHDNVTCPTVRRQPRFSNDIRAACGRDNTITALTDLHQEANSGY